MIDIFALLLVPCPPELARADGFASITAHGRDGITGGKGGAVTEVKTLESLIRHVANSEPTILAVQGTIKAKPAALVRVASNRTICGSEADAELVGIELHPVNVSNVIIKNLTIRDSFVASHPSAKAQNFYCNKADAVYHLRIDRYRCRPRQRRADRPAQELRLRDCFFNLQRCPRFGFKV